MKQMLEMGVPTACLILPLGVCSLSEFENEFAKAWFAYQAQPVSTPVAEVIR